MIRPFLLCIQKIFRFFSFAEPVLQKHSLVIHPILRYNECTEAHLN